MRIDPIDAEVMAFLSAREQEASAWLDREAARARSTRTTLMKADTKPHRLDISRRRLSPAMVAPMTWFYWDTFWSLAGSLVWFITIVSNPDAVISER